MVKGLSRWAGHRSSWLLLFLSALALILTALYFQYEKGLAPCIMCIYQRTAMFGIMLAGLLVVLLNTLPTRVVGFAGWGISSGWGWLLAREHVDILHAPNPFFASCEIVPNFPSWAPLHEWLPAVFAAKGDCLEDSWRFMDKGMAEWMMIIFAVYFVMCITFLLIRLVGSRRF
ncbi:disulfide bond formation protein DsbB [Alteromonas ponticola]|uniref:Disulfide bond formation protein B n=1 Tax=Alteromonas aquimaris TaxID=2998417 RepID=A0ABT3P6F1_9ALTE|nr:disulfide bond formation protein DsbB [Alteromonas aquimaris]MCW8108347.1 disulfide bond formation protein DsbB [Alteromonas aquimaris]